MSTRSCFEYLLLLVLAGIGTAITAQEFDDEESPRQPGIVATYTSAAGPAATRIDESLVFNWDSAPPDPRLPGDGFSAIWRGRLWVQSPGVHRVHVYVQGSVKVQIGGQEIVSGESVEPQWLLSDPLNLPFDYHLLEIQYRRTGKQGRLGLYWSGPGFVLEPIPARFLFHDRNGSVSMAFEQGRHLAEALRCTSCHRDLADSGSGIMAAPALDRLSGNLHREWLVQWLAAENNAEQAAVEAAPAAITRRMPHFDMTADEAAAVADWLLRPVAATGAPSKQADTKEARNTPDAAKDKSTPQDPKGKQARPSVEQGQRLFLTLGCLACHQHGDLGESGLFGGGDLTKIAAKRPAPFFERWLAEPTSLNKHYRMPVFDLTPVERKSLAIWLTGQQTASKPQKTGDTSLDRGRKLVAQFRCAACHTLPAENDQAPEPARPLSAASNWTQSCAGDATATNNRPSYRLSEEPQTALRAYFSGARAAQQPNREASPAVVGRDLLVQLNCLACHQREGIDRKVNALPARLQDKLAAVAELHSDLAKELPGMTPPALNSVGDKLHDAALAAAIRREGPPHRPYLLARMPKFRLTDEQLAALTAYFVSTDRIPAPSPQPPAPSPATPPALIAAGPRLVTTEGFGCTSCHQVGSVKADKAPLNARGPDLSLLSKRIRREWFDRWCASPARIVPRMEMPSVQVPVRGVLNDNVHDQLAAVWNILNTPGFEPPEPNPVRVLRLSGVPERKEQPIVLHDVVKDGNKTYLFPLVIGLPNRHNILFDLETNRLAAWWLGDTARQRTKGKSWHWEVGGKSLMPPTSREPEISLVIGGKAIAPVSIGQYTARLGETHARVGTHDSRSLEQLASMKYRLGFAISERREPVTEISVIERFGPLPPSDRGTTGFARAFSVEAPQAAEKLKFRLVDRATAAESSWNAEQRVLTLPGETKPTIALLSPREVEWSSDGTITFTPASWGKTFFTGTSDFLLSYKTSLPPDQHLLDSPPPSIVDPIPLEIAPGFSAHRLAFPDDIMPSAISFRPGGRLVFASLKGQVYIASDTNEDGDEDHLDLVADGFASPYGLPAPRTDLLTNDVDRGEPIDVLGKDGLWRLLPCGESSTAEQRQLVASGWGITDDYHDWAIGLIPGEDGEYFMALPCQQDKRSEAAAKHRGQFLKLVPRKATPDNPHLFDIEVLSSGHRFPMGIAKNRAGDLFVTDNQGNYNPFNELNHVRPGKHFGFINANEKEAGFEAPPVEEPAINIPHPWTRSVNGICFLDTPQSMRDAGQDNHFGPLEGHLIGCEYDTRRLIRMTLQKIGDTYQGAAYPLSIPPEDVEKGLLGPIVCAVSPRGELYVGEIRDSGWGAGNNIGQIVKIKIEPDKLPCGIAEMRATETGFTLDFFQPVDANKAADAANYSLQSYRRESTPAYGGPDVDRHIEVIEAAEVSEDCKRVALRLPEMRTGFVYELKLKNLAPKNAMFHPDEAHFTLRQIPQ